MIDNQSEEDFYKRFFSTKGEAEAEALRKFNASLGLKIDTNKFIGVTNLGEFQPINSKTPLLFKIVSTPKEVIFRWITENKLSPYWYIQPVGWEHPDFCNFMIENEIEYIVDESV